MTFYSALKNALDNAHFAAMSGQLVAAHFGERYTRWMRCGVWISGFILSRFVSRMREHHWAIKRFEDQWGFHNGKVPDPDNQYYFLLDLEEYCARLPLNDADLFRWTACLIGYAFDDDALDAACARKRQFIREFLAD